MASVPHDNTPDALAFTSQVAVLREGIVIIPSVFIENAETVEVENVVGEEVAKNRFPLILLIDQWFEVREASERVNCERVEEASCNVQRGVVVPSPRRMRPVWVKPGEAPSE